MFKVDVKKVFTMNSANRKMEYFFNAVYNNERMYIFSEDDEIAFGENAEGILFLPIYPSSSTASYAIETMDRNSNVEEISLDEFLKIVLPELEKEDVQLAVFYDGQRGILLELEDFLDRLEN